MANNQIAAAEAARPLGGALSYVPSTVLAG
jgi:hypothetical protein